MLFRSSRRSCSVDITNTPTSNSPILNIARMMGVAVLPNLPTPKAIEPAFTTEAGTPQATMTLNAHAGSIRPETNTTKIAIRKGAAALI